MYACHSCAAEVPDPREVFRTTACAKCGRDLHVCLNCRFYSPGAHWDCAESVDEPVRDKDRGNFCTFFSFKAGPGGTGRANDKAREARRKMDSLFGDGS